MVRRRVEIDRIEDKAKRQTTFTKRRKGLFKKAEKLGKKCNVDIAVIASSDAGDLYAFGNPSVNTVINRYMVKKSAEDGQMNETNEGFQANYQAKTSSKNDSISPKSLSIENKLENDEFQHISRKIEEIKSKILSFWGGDSVLHGLDEAMVELQDMEGTMQDQIKARTPESNND